ncbi:cytochrome C oxidase subunit IV family protein [Luteimonas sp. BDR2-5]|uniref:cytochrome C oxidase subunit IV family protein n=1 Tax=Proluteimonas luteida TaxID=2878685 RepID=UPI001E54EDE7|nr:cytochrome C oxidase subunit IV family protein [Luteimonas sp. BDR2-5]MCD9029149.1 cytochrome C oxidase subunit IV family protein [Luteimonas sp. BDR2-5]
MTTITRKQLLPTHIALIWASLVALSLLGPNLGSEREATNTIAVMVLAFGAIKVRFVGLYFMELKHAPLKLRLAFEAYCLLLFGWLSWLYVSL